jgi:predicted lipid-binding transport protein (Tim44 family)
MERFPVELIYVLVFLGIVVFNFMRQLAARRRQQEEEAQAKAAAPAPAEEQPLEDLWGRTPAPAVPAAAAAAAAAVIVTRPAPPAIRAEPPATPRRLHPVRALLQDRRDLRRAVILMMVLGPCRAQEPPERTR